MGRHCNVALFVPHAGCPHQCSFCNQRAISGQVSPLSPQEIVTACERAAATMASEPADAEIAFFGGSFTAVAPAYRRSLLEVAAPYVEKGWFSGIRISTRPDAVNPEILEELKKYHVTAIELGAQSMRDEVLACNRRGHTAEEVAAASRMIRNAGFSLGLQMMTGLPGDTAAGAVETARRLAALGPDTMRIYPTIVMKDTPLAHWYEEGRYQPPSLEKTVELCAGLLRFFEEEKDIPVIRLGLHAEKEMLAGKLAGPWHPAFRQLCEGWLYRQKAMQQLRLCLPQGGKAVIRVHPRAVSAMVGQKRCNLTAFLRAGYQVKVTGDTAVPQGMADVAPL